MERGDYRTNILIIFEQVKELLISGLVGSETKGFGLNLAYGTYIVLRRFSVDVRYGLL